MGCLVRVGWVAPVLMLAGKVTHVLVLRGRVTPVLVLGLQVGDGPDGGEIRDEEFL